VALWGNLANMFDLQVGQILAIKNAKVSDFSGKSLNCGDDQSSMFIEPDHFRTIDLERWHAANGGQNLQSMSGVGGSGDGSGGRSDNQRLIKEMLDGIYKDDSMMSGSSQGQYYKLSGYV